MSRLPTASQTPRVMACPASEALPHVEKLPSEVASAGTGRHELLVDVRDGKSPSGQHADWAERLIEDGILEDLRGYRAEVALAYDVAFGGGRELGERLGRAYPTTHPSELVGSADYLRVTAAGTVVVVDLKTGMTPVDARDNAQLLTLALAACRAYGSTRAEVGILQAPEGMEPRWSWWEVSEERLEQHAAELAQMYADLEDARSDVKAGRTVRHVAEGSHCRYCPAQAACPKRSAIATAAVTAPTYRAQWMALASEGRTAEVWRALQVLRGEADEMERILREMARMGPVDLGGGKHLAVKTVQRESIDGATAWPVLAALLGEHASAAVTMEVSKASVERGVKAAKAAGRLAGSIKAGVEQVMAEARAAGAVTTKQVERYEETSK